MIKQISFDEIYEIWSKHLWPHRTSPIETNSAMMYLGGYTMDNMVTVTTFFGYYIDDKLIGVNSGHSCSDNSYRSRGVYVMPEYRKREIGKKLLLATIEQGRKQDCDFVWSYPRHSSWNTYKSAGFVLTTDWERSETSEANAYCRIDL